MALALFALIIGIAGLGTFFYYRAVNRPPDKPRKEPRGSVIASHALSAIASEIAARAKGKPDEIPGDDEDLVKEHGYPLRSHFIPSEDGIYHRASLISERGWSDLACTLNELSILPAAAFEIVNILYNPNATASELENAASQAPELTSRILTIVNSPFYRLESDVLDLTGAVEHLGSDEIHQFVYIANVFQPAVSQSHQPAVTDLWKHSRATSHIVTWLSRKITHENPDKNKFEFREPLAGTSALLHDIGKLVLEQWRPEAYRKALRASHEKNTQLMSEELRHLGITHALAGALLIDSWRLPKSLSITVKGSHLPIVSDDFPEAALVWLAGQTARTMSMGIDGEIKDEIIPGDIRDLLKIQSETITELLSVDFRDFVTHALADCRIGVT